MRTPCMGAAVADSAVAASSWSMIAWVVASMSAASVLAGAVVWWGCAGGGMVAQAAPWAVAPSSSFSPGGLASRPSVAVAGGGVGVVRSVPGAGVGEEAALGREQAAIATRRVPPSRVRCGGRRGTRAVAWAGSVRWPGGAGWWRSAMTAMAVRTHVSALGLRCRARDVWGGGCRLGAGAGLGVGVGSGTGFWVGWGVGDGEGGDGAVGGCCGAAPA